MYTSSIDLTQIQQHDILLLNQAAGKLSLPRLQWLCEHYLQDDLTMDTVYPLLKASHELKVCHCCTTLVTFVNLGFENYISAPLVGTEREGFLPAVRVELIQ